MLVVMLVVIISCAYDGCDLTHRKFEILQERRKISNLHLTKIEDLECRSGGYRYPGSQV